MAAPSAEFDIGDKINDDEGISAHLHRYGDYLYRPVAAAGVGAASQLAFNATAKGAEKAWEYGQPAATRAKNYLAGFLFKGEKATLPVVKRIGERFTGNAAANIGTKVAPELVCVTNVIPGFIIFSVCFSTYSFRNKMKELGEICKDEGVEFTLAAVICNPDVRGEVIREMERETLHTVAAVVGTIGAPLAAIPVAGWAVELGIQAAFCAVEVAQDAWHPTYISQLKELKASVDDPTAKVSISNLRHCLYHMAKKDNPALYEELQALHSNNKTADAEMMVALVAAMQQNGNAAGTLKFAVNDPHGLKEALARLKEAPKKDQDSAVQALMNGLSNSLTSGGERMRKVSEGKAAAAQAQGDIDLVNQSLIQDNKTRQEREKAKADAAAKAEEGKENHTVRNATIVAAVATGITAIGLAAAHNPQAAKQLAKEAKAAVQSAAKTARAEAAPLANNLKNQASKASRTLKDEGKKAVDWVKTEVPKMVEKGTEAVKKGAKKVGQAAENVSQKVAEGAQKTKEFVVETGQKTKKAAKKAVESSKKVIEEKVVEPAKEFVQTAKKKVKDKGVKETIYGAVGDGKEKASQMATQAATVMRENKKVMAVAAGTGAVVAGAAVIHESGKRNKSVDQLSQNTKDAAKMMGSTIQSGGSGKSRQSSGVAAKAADGRFQVASVDSVAAFDPGTSATNKQKTNTLNV